MEIEKILIREFGAAKCYRYAIAYKRYLYIVAFNNRDFKIFSKKTEALDAMMEGGK
jgi:hypothetical protein